MDTGGGMVDVDTLTLLAEGGQARVYHYGDDRVLRVMRNAADAVMLKNEIAVIGELRRAGVAVPEVYGYMEIEGKPAAVSEKIKGRSLMEYLHPLGIVGMGRRLGEMHLRLAKAAADVPLQGGKNRSRYMIGQSEVLDDTRKKFVYSLIDALPEGSDLCHGDFHPGNILREGERDYIIDWVGVHRGDILSDAANTYLLMTTIPRAPGVSPMQYRAMRLMGPLLVRGYMGAIRRGYPFDRGVFSRWVVVKAAERTVHGLPGEKGRLVAFVGTCCDLKQRGVPPEKWVRKL